MNTDRIWTARIRILVSLCLANGCAGRNADTRTLAEGAGSARLGTVAREAPPKRLRQGKPLIPRGSGPYGARGPLSIEDASPNADWIVECQAREDTNGDGELSVEYGTHGGVFGDRMPAYLIRVGGPGEVIFDYWGSSPDGRYAVGQRERKLELYDLRSGESWMLGDLIPDEPDTPYHVRGVDFTPDSKRLLFAPATKHHRILVYLIELETRSLRQLSLGTGLLRKASLSPGGQWIEAEVVPEDTDGNGKLEIRPIRTTSLASEICDGGWSDRLFETEWLNSSGSPRGDDDAYRTLSLEPGAKWRTSYGIALGKYRFDASGDGWVGIDWRGKETVIVPEWCAGVPLLAHVPTEQVLAACSGRPAGNASQWNYFVFSDKDFLDTRIEVPDELVQSLTAEPSETVHEIRIGRTSSTTRRKGRREVVQTASPFDRLGPRYLFNWKNRDIRKLRYSKCEEDADWGVYDEHPDEGMTYVLRDGGRFAPYVRGDCNLWPRMTLGGRVEPGGVMRVDNQVVIPRERVIGVTPDPCVLTYLATASGHALVSTESLCGDGSHFDFSLERALEDSDDSAYTLAQGALEFVRLDEPAPQKPIHASASCVVTAPVEEWTAPVPRAFGVPRDTEEREEVVPEESSWEWIAAGHPKSEEEELALRKAQERYDPRAIGADSRVRAAVEWEWGRASAFAGLYDSDDPQPLVRFESREEFIKYLRQLGIPTGTLADRASTVFDMMRDAVAVEEAPGVGQLAATWTALSSLTHSPLKGFQGAFSQNSRGDGVLVLWRGSRAYQIETKKLFEALQVPQIFEGRLYRRIYDKGVLSLIAEVAANSLAQKLGTPLRFASIDYPSSVFDGIGDHFIMAPEKALCQLSDDAMIETLTSPSPGESDNWSVVIPD